MIEKPYLLFLGDVDSDIFGKTAFGLRDWCREDVVGQHRLAECTVDLHIAEMAPAVAADAGARSMVVAVASIGGALPSHWIPTLIEALEAGLDLVSGMHAKLSDVPELAEAAKRLGRKLHDVRHTDAPMPIANGQKRSGKRVLMVGTDCSCGKKYTALALAREMKKRGMDADFRATGQTGIMIAGEGVAIDAVVADFIAGAAETLSPASAYDHWDVIEGQGSLFHPAYAGVTLGLIHGSQADALVLCHDPSRSSIHGYPGYRIVSLQEAIDGYLAVARLTNPDVRFAGISFIGSRIDDARRAEFIRVTERETGLPVCDPVDSGVAPIADRLEKW